MRRLTRPALTIAVVLLLTRIGFPSSASGRGAAPAPTTPKPGPAAPGVESLRLRGTVVTGTGKRYTGVLRWGDEEAFWDDIFNGNKADRPYSDRQPEKERPRHEVRILGFVPIGFWEEGESGRQYAARFGDIKEIRPVEDDSVEVVMKSGAKYRLDGGSGDIGAVIHVDDPVSGAIDLNWRGIQKIVFEAATPPAQSPSSARGTAVPANAAAGKPSRLFGDVSTKGGAFKGFILWDSQECLSTDLLDGDSHDGRISLEMGRIRTIAKKGENGVHVETTDGRVLDLTGTNDVNGSIRGILVEDDRYGRVNVSWDAFQRMELHDAPPVGRGYADYPPAHALQGTITDRAGKRWQGRIVFDLDESETWEMLDGKRQGVDYSIPFDRVRSLEPLGKSGTSVMLRNGQKIQLEGTQDVSEKNAGVLVIEAKSGAEHYVPWRGVARIDLE